ncbi:Metallo-dependent phosphatase-like protein [Globomyces pollinis-pini]|nr:Metallo-dependent phosphatase-like protein [Globomyces pollinis-pini]
MKQRNMKNNTKDSSSKLIDSTPDDKELKAKENNQLKRSDSYIKYFLIPIGCLIIYLTYAVVLNPDQYYQSLKSTTASGQSKIIAIGDLHGDLPNTLKTFKMAGLIDDKHDWCANDTIFVQTGDIVDRGPDTIELYKLMMKLTAQAESAGGKVVELLGNHEVMNMHLDYRYVTQEDIASFGGVEKRVEEWSNNGWLGSYLRTLGISAWVNGTVFFHGGANTKWAKLTVSGINKQAKEGLELPPQESYRWPIFGGDGPLWYRGYAQDPPSVCEELETALKHMNATRMVVGHTPQASGEILKRCDGQVYVIDVGISRVYGGHSAAIEIVGDEVTALYASKRVRLK